MPSTKTSLPSPSTSGGSLQHLEPDAAHPETLTGLPCSKETLLSLVAICTALLNETRSSDAMWLAMRRAETLAALEGVREKEFYRVRTVVGKHWMAQRRVDPISGMF